MRFTKIGQNWGSINKLHFQWNAILVLSSLHLFDTICISCNLTTRYKLSRKQWTNGVSKIWYGRNSKLDSNFQLLPRTSNRYCLGFLVRVGPLIRTRVKSMRTLGRQDWLKLGQVVADKFIWIYNSLKKANLILIYDW